MVADGGVGGVGGARRDCSNRFRSFFIFFRLVRLRSLFAVVVAAAVVVVVVVGFPSGRQASSQAEAKADADAEASSSAAAHDTAAAAAANDDPAAGDDASKRRLRLAHALSLALSLADPSSFDVSSRES